MASDAYEREQRSVPGSVSVDFADPSAARIALHGEWDISNQAHLENVFDLAISRRRNVVVDLAECTFLDSRTIGQLMMFAWRADERGGRLALVLPQSEGAVHRAFALLGVREVLPVYDTLEDACRELARRSTRIWFDPSPPMPVD